MAKAPPRKRFKRASSPRGRARNSAGKAARPQRKKIVAGIIERLQTYDDAQLAKLRASMDAIEAATARRGATAGSWAPAESYKTRSNAAENIIGFIERLYGSRLDGDFTRADLKRHDEGAYVALANWLRSNDLPEHVQLPTVQERNARLIREGRIEQLRAQDRLTPNEAKELRKLASIRSKMQRRGASMTC